MKYLKMSDADLELNQKYKLEDKLNSANSEGEESEEEESGGEEEMGGSEEGGGAEEEGGSEIDDEMLGEVQPESSETTQLDDMR